MAIFGKGKRNKERRYEGKEKKTREKLKKKKKISSKTVQGASMG